MFLFPRIVTGKLFGDQPHHLFPWTDLTKSQTKPSTRQKVTHFLVTYRDHVPIQYHSRSIFFEGTHRSITFLHWKSAEHPCCSFSDTNYQQDDDGDDSRDEQQQHQQQK
jgi:hypothetical protein